MSRRVTGFTLIELLVAMAIFAIISMLALGGLNTVITQQTLTRQEMDELAQLQRTMRLLTGDFSQLNPRMVRDSLGRATEPYLATYGAGEYLVRLTRAGWSNPANLPRGTLQRVQYRIEDQQLIREYWPVLDPPLGMEPNAELLLTGVVEASIEYLDVDGAWQSQWPPLELLSRSTPPRPRAARIKLELEDWGELERLVEIAR